MYQKNKIQNQIKESLTQHGISNLDEKLLCKLCHLERPKFEYTISNLKRKENRVCMYCLTGNNLDDMRDIQVEPAEALQTVPIPEKFDSETLINKWTEELNSIKIQIKEMKNSLDTQLVGPEHKSRRKTTRDQLSKHKIEKTSLKDKIESEKAYAHLQRVLPLHNEVTQSQKIKCLESPQILGFAGKYLSRSDEDNSDTLTQNILYLNPGKTWTLHHTVNLMKLSLANKALYSGEYQGYYTIEIKDGQNRLSGVTEYPKFKKIHSLKQTQPPKHRAEFFNQLMIEVEGLIEGKFSKEKLSMKIHFGQLYSADNWVLEHYFATQKIQVERQ